MPPASCSLSIFHAACSVSSRAACAIGVRLCDPVLDHLLVGQDRTLGVAGQRPLAQQVERSLRLAEPAHCVMDAAGPEALLGQRETLADAGLAADDVFERNADLVVDDLGVTTGFAGLVIGLTHGRHVAQDVHAGRVGRHDDHRECADTAMRLVEVGLDHDDQDVGQPTRSTRTTCGR